MVAAAFDGTDAERFAAFHERVRDELGEVDGLITCAGRWEPKPFEEIAVADFAEMFTANATTAFVACRSVLPAMIARRSGSVVNFASTAGEYGSISPAAHYAAAKGAVIAMTKSLAREASPHNVRVNADLARPDGHRRPRRRDAGAEGDRRRADAVQPPRPARRDRGELRLPASATCRRS